MRNINTSRLLAILLTIIILPAYSQKEYNTWCFGDSSQINFNSGAPVNLPPTNMSTKEGTACISDKITGDLLFYTDGVQVYNRNHQVMPGNIKPLGGNYSTTQSALIIPKPGSDHEYYLFANDAQVGKSDVPGGGDSGTQYSIIDMNLDSGLGDVSQQPIRLLTPGCEAMAATSMPNGQGYWLIVHQWNSDAFYAYPVTATGVGAPVITNTGIVHAGMYTNNSQAIGIMRTNYNGTKLAISTTYLQRLEIFDFDAATGSVGNNILTDSVTLEPLGLCFSPSNRFLYVMAQGSGVVYQYDLAAGNADAIFSSREAIGTPPILGYCIQKGPDNKLYITNATYSSLDRINNPDVKGTACNYEPNAFALSHNSIIGLPEFPVTYVKTCNLSATISTNKTIICPTDSANICATGNFNSYLWNTNETSQCIKVSQAGNYYVMVGDTNGCTAESNHVAIAVYPVSSVSIILSKDTLTSFGAVSYQWYKDGRVIDGSTSATYVAKEAGSYFVAVTDSNGCLANSSPISVTGIADIEQQQISIYPNPTVGGWQLTVNNELIGSMLEVYNADGQLIFQSEIKNLKSKIDLSVARGIYWLRIASQNANTTYKLVRL